MFKVEVGKVIKDFKCNNFILLRSLLRCFDNVQIAREAPRYLYAASGWSWPTSSSHTN